MSGMLLIEVDIISRQSIFVPSSYSQYEYFVILDRVDRSIAWTRAKTYELVSNLVSKLVVLGRE